MSLSCSLSFPFLWGFCMFFHTRRLKRQPKLKKKNDQVETRRRRRLKPCKLFFLLVSFLAENSFWPMHPRLIRCWNIFFLNIRRPHNKMEIWFQLKWNCFFFPILWSSAPFLFNYIIIFFLFIPSTWMSPSFVEFNHFKCTSRKSVCY